MDTFELSSISQHDQVETELTRRAALIARFYRAMVEEALPEEVAKTITVEWARASLQGFGESPCGCDCDICRGEPTG